MQILIKLSASIIHRSASAATSFQSRQCFTRKNCSNLVVQFIGGRPKGPLPEGCQCSIRRAQRSWGRFMIYMAGKFPMFRSASFCPCFHVICSHDLSHTLISDMQNFVPRIPPADPVWSSNHASDHGPMSHAHTTGSWEHMFPLYLLAHRWSQRLLSWHPFGARRVGRPRHTWESLFFQNFMCIQVRKSSIVEGGGCG